MGQEEQNPSRQQDEGERRTDGGRGELKPRESGETGCQITVEQLGGITEAEVNLPPGVSLLTGQNATNRSSLLRALAAAIGAESAAAHLKSDVDQGSVTAAIGEQTYTRTYERQNGAVRKGGEPYTEAPEIIDTFVALFADNPLRTAVSRGGDLRELLMGPVNTDAINAAIGALQEEQSTLESRIEDITSRERKLPGLEEDKKEYEAELDRLVDEIADRETAIEDFDAGEDESDEMAALREELDDHRARVSSVESELDQLEQKLSFREEERENMEDELESVLDELDAFDDPDALTEEIQSLTNELEARETDRRELEIALEDLQTAIQANEDLLDGTFERLGIGDAGDHVTDALDPEAQVLECWTCGNEVERATLQEQIERLREVATARRSDVADLEVEIRDIRNERQAVQQRRDEYERLLARREELEDGIERHRERAAELETERADKRGELEDMEAELESLQTEMATLESTADDGDESELVAAHQELTSLQRERGRVESKLEAVRNQIAEIEDLRQEREEAESRLKEITVELEELRGKIDALEADLVETLNTLTEDLIERLDYRNISRVWLERLRSEEGRTSEFDLHIVREAADGAVYEDTVETLSESEREVVGLAVALAGYLVHDVDQEVPFLLFDSVEMIDGDRMATLLEYVVEQTSTEYLVVAMLPKDAAAVEEADALGEYSLVEAETIG